MLGSDKTTFDVYIQNYQATAVSKFREAFEVMRAEEKKVYQHKSYFARIDSEPYAAGDLSSDPDNVDPEVGTLADHPTVRYQPEVGPVGVVPAQLCQQLSPRA